MLIVDSTLMFVAISFHEGMSCDTGFVNRRTGEIAFVWDSESEALSEGGNDVAIESYVALNRFRLHLTIGSRFRSMPPTTMEGIRRRRFAKNSSAGTGLMSFWPIDDSVEFCFVKPRYSDATLSLDVQGLGGKDHLRWF